MAVRECRICGKEFQPSNGVQVCCSADCQNQRRLEVKRKSNRRSRERYRRIHGRAKPAGNAPRGPFVCNHCGRNYYTKRSKGQGETFCSRQCAFDSGMKPPQRVSLLPIYTQLKLCDGCQTSVIKPGRKLCGDCKDTVRQVRAISKCSHCGEWFDRNLCGKGKQSTLCGDRCRESAQKKARSSARKKRGSGRHRARARYYGVDYEYINTVKVFERDGWRCQICGVSTPKSRRGTKHFNAPELDHIVPMSKGGGHLYSNVQCACKKCNAEKSDRMDYPQQFTFFMGLRPEAMGTGGAA